MTDDHIALIAKSLAHPARIHIVRLLAEQTECRGHDVFSELPLAQSTVSEHLRVLKDAGLVTSRPLGMGMSYCLVPEVLEEFGTVLSEIAKSAIARGLAKECCTRG